MDRTSESLATLQTRLVDACKGYEDGETRTDDAEMIVLFRALRHMHAQHAAALASHLAARGVEPDADGSFLQYVHKAVLALRSTFGGLDEDAIPGVRDGEERILGLYDDALRETGAEPDLVATLERQRDEVARAIQRMRLAEQPVT